MINESLLMQERRTEVRYSLNGLVPLRLELEKGQVLDAIFLDASTRGLGMIVEPSLKVDQQVLLKVGGGIQLKMSVRWIKKPMGLTAPGVPVFHRAGVCLLQGSGSQGEKPSSILEILENFHCVDH
ncbi:PilZ domain-containing protein [Pseudobacteriovorax antillogorgiicola]|uniref:PilZ domain-containing protein n=1 Tax=Pseudobacteriovorax antillogorgiicola TaxID=1513793 RepID=A0A1Y6CUY7_9BACT|nr:PilZ domain-containing protein [Pseudobacteriovorax antillogorgiicola]TCS44990.1 PilZ domain-containing protein [Pseudobacteriovorax antillogorgiicola]SMF76631.1 PilZ domain-containing protein [Pseudobacteriovorax antillogorgiicola]